MVLNGRTSAVVMSNVTDLNLRVKPVFANVAGFDLGKLQFITELGGGVFNQGVVRAESFSIAVATVISPGELDVTVTVQAVWAID